MLRIWLALAALLCLAACEREPSPDRGITEVRIAAAASLKPVLPEIIAAFGRAHPEVHVVVTYGASGNFYSQLVNGAPFDVFLSADTTYPQKLSDVGLTAGSLREYAAGRLVLWTHRSTGLDADALGSLDVLTDERISRVAIANPRHAPYGRGAETALRTAGLLDRVQPKLVLGESVEQTATFARTGAAEVGLLPKSQAVAPPMSDEGVWAEIPDNLYEPIRHGAVIVKGAVDTAAAESLMDFLLGPEAQALLARGGLGRVGD